MALTGIGFATVTRFAPLLVVGFIGTLNPSGGDVSLFLPTEQAVLADLTETDRRPRFFAIYNLAARAHRGRGPARVGACRRNWRVSTDGTSPQRNGSRSSSTS